MNALNKQKPSVIRTQNNTAPRTPGLERLERAIAHLCLASRREAKALIIEGLVSVNGKVVKEPGFGIKEGSDSITITGTTVAEKETYLVYKKRGIETTKTTPTAKDLHSEFPNLAHLNAIGRLDKESEGLIIMSNDGTLTKALTKENSTIGKTYKVTVQENLPDQSLEKMRRGIVLNRIKTKPAIVERLSRTSFSITLFEGRKHQIRRMCDACRLTIESLIRTNIGTIAIGSMKPSSSRKLTATEIQLLKQT